MTVRQPRPILITGGGRRIGLALAHHFLDQQQPVIVSYRTHYPAIDALRDAGAICLTADFSTDEQILAFAEAVNTTPPAACAPSSITPATGWLKSRAFHSPRCWPA